MSSLFFRQKDSEKKETSYLLLLSLLSFALCIVCLTATTWAWFAASATTESNVISTATFGVDVVVADGANPVSAVDDVYTLSPGKAYTVTLTKTGSASAGFCVVTIDGTDYYTEQITHDTYTFVLNVTGAADVPVTFTPYWGQIPDSATGFIGTPSEIIASGTTNP